MKYGLVVLVGISASCVPQAPHRTVNIEPPKVLRSEGLKVGQWATYIERDSGLELGRLYLGAVAVAACGTWVRVHVTNGPDWRTWMLCVRDDGAPPGDRLARAMLDDGATHRIDVANLGEHRAEIDVLLSRVVPPALTGQYVREDVTVDAGEFRQTLRVDNAGASTWLHPAVPFGGAVKVSDGHGREDVLYELGDAGADVERDFVRSAARSRNEGSYELGASYGWFSGTSRRPSDTEPGFFVNMLRPASRHLDVVGRISGLYSSNLDSTWFGLGARWSPLRRDRGFATNQLFGQATIDYAQLSDSNRNTLGRGAGLSTGIGYSAQSRHDWTFTINVDHHFAYLNAGHGLTQSFSLGAGFQLAFP